MQHKEHMTIILQLMQNRNATNCGAYILLLFYQVRNSMNRFIAVFQGLTSGYKS